MPSFLGTEASRDSSAARRYWSPTYGPPLEKRREETEVMRSWSKEANEQIRYKHAYSQNIPHMSDMLRDQPTATKPWEPADALQQGRWLICDQHNVLQTIGSKRFMQGNDKQLSMKPPSNPPSAKPWQTLRFLQQPHVLHQNIIPTSELFYRQDRVINASPLGTRGRKRWTVPSRVVHHAISS